VDSLVHAFWFHTSSSLLETFAGRESLSSDEPESGCLVGSNPLIAVHLVHVLTLPKIAHAKVKKASGVSLFLPGETVPKPNLLHDRTYLVISCHNSSYISSELFEC